jgi:predicted NAD/FAD-dependent oxidoreductase
MSSSTPHPRVAVIGAGIAGATCAASLHQAGWRVTVFEKSRGVGGRMATRRAQWLATDQATGPVDAEFDHGAQLITPLQPRFRAAMQRAVAAGVLAHWSPRVHAMWPAPLRRDSLVPVVQMPALCRHLLGGVEPRLLQQVQRLQRGSDGWHVVTVDGSSAGPFDQVLLAMPPAQAAVLLAGHQDDWADTLAAVRMEPCWTLMAATQELDWPWDACEPSQGPLAWVARNDRKPGRARLPGTALWVAHASPVWSAAHHDDKPDAVLQALSQALTALLPAGTTPQWQHRSLQRWRYAVPVAQSSGTFDGADCWWDADIGLGVCGDFMGRGDTGGIESAWRSGDELADTLLAALDDETVVQQPAVEQHDERDLAHAD